MKFLMGFLPTKAVRTGWLAVMMVMPLLSAAHSVSAAHPVKTETVSDSANLVKLYQKGVELLQSDSTANSEQALSYLEKVATDNQSEWRLQARVWLGRAYRDGLAGTPKDLKKSFIYFEQAAGKEGRNAEAQFELGKAYLNGTGTDRNLIAAYMWTALSLKQSFPLEAEARQQKRQLSGMLNDIQLEKARLLVTQLETFYLSQ